MYRWLLPITWLLVPLSLAVNLGLWGGLAHTPRLGPALSAAVERQASLTATYVGLGRPLLQRLGWARSAAEHTSPLLSVPAEAVIEGPPGLLVERVHAALPEWARLSHHATPWLLLAGLVLSWIKPKPVHITSRGG